MKRCGATWHGWPWWRIPHPCSKPEGHEGPHECGACGTKEKR